MTITASEAEECFLANQYDRIAATSKVVEFQSRTNGRSVYLRLGQGFPSHADVVVHPDVDKDPLLLISGVQSNPRVEFRHGDHMESFPQHIHTGEKEIPYGRALQAESASALSELCLVYHKL